MKIHEIIMAQPMYQKYCDKYENPLISHYGKLIPESLVIKFIKQASIEELALYYFGYVGQQPYQFVSTLVYLERNGKFNVPVVEGILSTDYWYNWHVKNIVAVMDQGKIFGKG
jgi:hypothetical protein